MERLLLGSGGFRIEVRIQLLRDEVGKFLRGVERVLFVPYALADHDAYVRDMVENIRAVSAQQLQSIHKFSNPIKAVEEAQAIYVGGGNTFRLLKALYDFKLLEPIRRRVKAGMPYVGVSAGTNMALPSIKTTNDMPIIYPPSFVALGLVPFQINPHYFSGSTYVRAGTGYAEHCGETRDLRISEFHEENPIPVIGLWEGTLLKIENGCIRLVGAEKMGARIFRKGQPPQDVAPNQDLTI